ncbi:hypothetical protein D9611_009722 [Ephemerocybe angulata]|uniref:Uncharacterized protein n=1 Tax=Ephemerocybe angulata TaxID=980116 RepID=A0A8H5C5R2_9AGAR|nr:hypothetical protein D9611_009722 [Tulosesus angulatus]
MYLPHHYEMTRTALDWVVISIAALLAEGKEGSMNLSSIKKKARLEAGTNSRLPPLLNQAFEDAVMQLKGDMLVEFGKHGSADSGVHLTEKGKQIWKELVVVNGSETQVREPAGTSNQRDLPGTSKATVSRGRTRAAKLTQIQEARLRRFQEMMKTFLHDDGGNHIALKLDVQRLEEENEVLRKANQAQSEEIESLRKINYVQGKKDNPPLKLDRVWGALDGEYAEEPPEEILAITVRALRAIEAREEREAREARDE